MSSLYIPKGLRSEIAADGKHRCGYCLTSEAITGMPMEVDHIIPRALGGRTKRTNLWLACTLCNDHKSDRIAAVDPLTDEIVRLFDPRRQSWSEHFVWSEAADCVIGQTPTGRATVATLQLNRPSMVNARRRWVLAGWHPPKDL